MNDLTNKYRPKTLDEVVGHDKIIASLKKILSQDKTPHAFMFAGPNGVGKSTLARIIGNMLDADIIEVDGATFGKVEIMREIAENLSYKGFIKEKKLLIVDEAHALSKSALDSWLKIIEEPYIHQYFIFCTTEPERIVKGIMQRCLYYNLHEVSEKDLMILLNRVLDSERKEIREEIKDFLVKNSSGSPRQLLKYLEQIQACTYEEAAGLIGYNGENPKVVDLCRLIVKGGNILNAIKMLQELKSMGPETIRIAIVNYLIGCIQRENNSAKVYNFLRLLALFEKPLYSNTAFASLLLSVGEALED